MSLLRTLRSSARMAQIQSMRYGKKQVDGQAHTRYYMSQGKLEDAGDYYKYKYVFDDVPEATCRFARQPTDPLADRSLYEWDNWMFEYHGQWWDMGSSVMHIMFIGMLPLLVLSFWISNAGAKEGRYTWIGKRDPTGYTGDLQDMKISFK